MWVSVCFLKRLPGIPGSPGLWTRQRPGGMELLDVAGPGHFAHRDVLGSRESGVDRAAAGESTRELLADRGSYGLEFRDGDELDTDIWDRLYGGMGRISRVDRRQGELAERRGLLILGILVERLARAEAHWPSLPSKRRVRDNVCSSPR